MQYGATAGSIETPFLFGRRQRQALNLINDASLALPAATSAPCPSVRVPDSLYGDVGTVLAGTTDMNGSDATDVNPYMADVVVRANADRLRDDLGIATPLNTYSLSRERDFVCRDAVVPMTTSIGLIVLIVTLVAVFIIAALQFRRWKVNQCRMQNIGMAKAVITSGMKPLPIPSSSSSFSLFGSKPACLTCQG